MIGFGNYTKKAKSTTITSLVDKCMVKIDPQESGFFDAVLNFRSKNKNINMFIEAVTEVKDASIKPFYRAIYDPAQADNHMIVFQKGNRPAVGHSYTWWVETAAKMSPVEGRQWHLATEYQYYAFLVWLINKLVKIGESVEEVLNKVMFDSKELGHYYNSENSTGGDDLELTGLRYVCGVYDLANTYKILKCSNEEAGGFWLAGGGYYDNSDDYPLVNLNHSTDVDDDEYDSVGLLVL